MQKRLNLKCASCQAHLQLDLQSQLEKKKVIIINKEKTRILVKLIDNTHLSLCGTSQSGKSPPSGCKSAMASWLVHRYNGLMVGVQTHWPHG